MENKEEIKQLLDDTLRLIIFEPWMNEQEYNEIIEAFLDESDTTMDKMVDDVLIGVKNGYSIEFQFDLLKKIFKK